MSPIVEKGLLNINENTNDITGLTHPNDLNRTKEMFLRLHEAGEVLLASEIEAWAVSNGWKQKDAEELGDLGQQIGSGKKPRIQGGPWWADDILDELKS